MTHERTDGTPKLTAVTHGHDEDGLASPVTRPLNRRVVMKASAALGAIAAAGGIGVGSLANPGSVAAAENGGTRAQRYSPGGSAFSTASAGDFATFQTDFPFYAIGANWDQQVGSWPVVELQVSSDGVSWGDTFKIAENHEDGGRANRENRLFTPLVFTGGESWVRYRTVDADGIPGTVTGLSFTYIDASDGPWEADVDAVLAADAPDEVSVADTGDDRVPPTVVTRQAWGADESYRFDTYGEIWPSEYETVHHVIVHHTDTATSQDPIVAIRSIYYYHAVDQGWGDIGYNYLVDRNGRIYEGRYGGQNVIGGHSYEYAVGSSGICIIGDYQDADPSTNALAGLVAIVSWVGRDLDPFGRANFLEAPNLPIICAHRDVNATTCPGDMLYLDLPEIRSLVGATLDDGDLETGHPGGIAVRDRVIVQTDDGAPLNVRSQAGRQYSVVGQIADGDDARVVDGPVGQNDNWYKITWSGGTGWVVAQYLIVSPPEIPTTPGDLVYGQNVRFTSETNIRRQQSTSSEIIALVPRNTWAFILAGPTTAGGYSWYQVRTYQRGDGWVIANNIAAAPVETSPVAKFSVGDTVEATEQINIRPRPGIAQTVVASTYAGSQFKITQPCFGVTEYKWYGVYGSFGGGWVVENTLRLVSSGTVGNFSIGDKVRTTEAMNFRTAAGTSAPIIRQVPQGTNFTVVGGPTSANGMIWYQIRGTGGTVGWGVQDSLVEVTPTPTGKFETGDTVRVTEAMNFRTSPSTSASVISQLAAGTTLTVVGGPTSANGYIWYQLRTSGGTIGWGVQDWLEAYTPPVTGKFAIGDKVRTNDSINFRTGPSTSSSLIRVVASGTNFTVVGGPTSGNGLVWYQIRGTGGTVGWGVQDYLDKVTAPPAGNKFAVGDKVRTNDSINFRSSPSTSGSVIRVVPAGTNFTVVGGPTSASGYIWYQIRGTGGTVGWGVQDYLNKV